MIVTGLRTPARPSLSSSTPPTATPASDPKDQISLERTELWKAVKNPTLGESWFKGAAAKWIQE